MTRGLADLARLDATALIKALAAKRIGALELLEASVAQAEASAKLNAVVRRDLVAARARARAIDDRRAKAGPDEPQGLLAGLPVTIKDTFDVDGMPATAGSRRFLDRAARDATAVGRMRSEGAVIWGKTNVPVLAADAQTWNRLYGATNNPWDIERTPGGSSGGPAAAVAAGITALELGSDLSGSLRLPASFCGIYAHKPTWGLVSQRGHVPPAPGTAAEADLNVVGPMARSARDLRLLLSILTESPLPATFPPAPLAGLKVGLWIDEPAFHLDPVVRTVIESFASRLAGEGAQVEPVERLVDAEALLDAFMTLLMSSTAETPARTWLRGPARLARMLGAGRLSWAGAVLATTATHRDWMVANEVRARMELSMRRVFGRMEVILAPCAPVPAFRHDHRARRRLTTSDGRKAPYECLMDWSVLASACGLPATAIPAGQTPGGLPVGVQVIGPRGGDSRTLAVAQALEEQVLGFTPPP